MEFTASTEEELDPVADAIIKTLEQSSIVLFTGDLGAGKTTLIKRICTKLGVKEAMSSPSFGLINQYEVRDHIVYHIDLYRVKDVEEVFDFGLLEILDSGSPCFIEWPEMAQEIWQDYDVTRVSITAENQQLRRIFVK